MTKLIYTHSTLLKTTPGSGCYSLRGCLKWSSQVPANSNKPQRPGVEMTAGLVAKTQYQNTFLYPLCLIMQLEALTCLRPATAATQHNTLLMGGQGILLSLHIRTEPFLMLTSGSTCKTGRETVKLSLTSAMCRANKAPVCVCVCVRGIKESHESQFIPTHGRLHWSMNLLQREQRTEA